MTIKKYEGMNKIQKTDMLFKKITSIIEQARQKAATAVNLTMVYTYFEIGRYIVEDEKQGEQRAEYGKSVWKELSERLTERFGNGFSVENLRFIRKFFLTYQERVNSIYQIDAKTVNTVYQIDKKVNTDYPIDKESVNTDYQIYTNFVNSDYEIDQTIPLPRFTLSWSHYLILMRVENPDARRFYEIEAAQQQWSVRQLARQTASSLYERLALSRNKKEVMRLANEGQTIEKPTDILKNPVTLEFLGLEEKNVYTENLLENRIISNLQRFLLEMGKGFLFEARQKRFTFEEQHFFVDLVLYNRLLQCYVLIDLKTDRLSHQNLGQMQMYVNYYDRYVKQEFEKSTVGILLCETANQMLVELTLPENANIYAAQYALYLPDKKLLQQKLKEWTEEFENLKENDNE
jgi:predicted nuclease of restriction endonuclease-like (RecB) superfamily